MDSNTAEVEAADGADDNDVDGNALRDGSMVGQWERRLRRSNKGGPKDWERRRLALVAEGGSFCIDSTLALREKRAR